MPQYRQAIVFLAVLLCALPFGFSFAQGPQVLEFNRTGEFLTSDSTVGFSLVFSADVSNVDAGDFQVLDGSFTPVGPGGPEVSSVTGSGADYSLTLDSLGNTGTYRIGFAPGSDIQGCAESIADGGFEAGTPSPVWTETSTNYPSPICDLACGPIPRTGDHLVWFGGAQSREVASVSQDVIIPTGQPILEFYLTNNQDSQTAPGFFSVTVDGNEEFLATAADQEIGWVLKQVDLSAYADGGVHTISFNYDSVDSTTSSFLLDDISMETCGAPSPQISEPVRFFGNNPIVTRFEVQPGSPSDTATFDLEFNKDVQNVDPSDFEVFESTRTAAEPFVSSVSGGPLLYNVVVDANGQGGLYVIDIASNNDIVSVDGGLPLLFGGSTDFQLAPGPPTAEILEFVTPRRTMPSQITVQYTEEVANLTLDEISLTRDGVPVAITGGSVQPPLSGRAYPVTGLTYASSEDGNYTFTVVPGDVVDTDSNPVSNTATFDFVLDATPPQLISAVPVTSSPTTNDTIEFDIEWSEPVVDFQAVTQIDIVKTGTADGGVNSIELENGSNVRYRISLIVSGDGTIAIGAAEGQTMDAAGNTSIAGAISNPITIDNTRPFPEIFSPDRNPTNADSVVYTINWNESIQGFTNSDLSVSTTGDVSFGNVAIDPTGDGQNFQATISGVSGTAGSLTLDIGVGVVTDAVGQTNLAASESVVYDAIPPTATFTAINSSPTFDSTLSWRVVFNEEIPSFTPSNIVVNGDVSFQSTEVTYFQGNTWFVMLNGPSGSGEVTVEIPAGGVTDAAGNVNPAAISSPPIERPLPEIVVGSLTVDVSNTSVTTVGDGEYDVAANAIINGIFRADTPIQIRGTAITGDGVIGQYFGQDIYEGPFSIDGNTGNVVLQNPAADTYIWGTLYLGICGMRILSDSLSLDGWFENAEFAGNGFTNLTLSSSGRSLGGFYLSPTRCNSTGALEFTVQQILTDSNALRFVGVQPVLSSLPYDSLSFTQFQVRNNGTLAGAGTLTKGGHDFRFTDISTSGAGFEFDVSFEGTDGVTVDFDPIVLAADGSLTVPGGSIRVTDGNFTADFDAPSFTNSSVLLLGEMTVPGTAPYGDVVLDGVTVNSNTLPASLSMPSGSVDVNGLPLELTEPGSFDKDGGFYVENLSLVDYAGVAIYFNDLRLNFGNVSLGSGGFDLLGLAYNFDVTEPEGAEGLRIKGGFGLPENMGAASEISFNADVSILETANGTELQLNGLQFCTPAGTDDDTIKIKNSNFSIPQVCFEYDQGPPEEFAGSLRVGIPEVITIIAELGIRGGLLDRVGLGVDDLDAPIDATGAFLQSIYGSAENLSRQPAEWTDTYFLFEPLLPPREVTVVNEGIPPVRVRGTVGATAGPEVLGEALLSAEVSALVDENQFRLDGALTIVIIEVGEGYVHCRWSGPNQGVAAGGYMTYQLVIRGEIDASLDFDGNFRGCAAITIRIPDGLPLGGLEFGGVRICIAALPFEIKGCLTFIVDWCVAISEDGSVSVSVEKSSEYRDWEVPFYQPEPITTTDQRTGEEKTLYMSVFNNFQQQEKFYHGDGKFQRRQAGSDSLQITLPEGEQAIVRLTYQNQDADPSFTITSPSGNIYTTDMVPGAIDPETGDAVYFTAPNRREAGYGVRLGEAGEYTVEVLYPDTLGEYAVEVLTNTIAPTIDIVDASLDGTNLSFQWTDRDPDSDATISLGIDTDRQGANGSVLLKDISEDDAANMASIDLASKPIQPGFYWPYAIIEDDLHGPVISYAPAMIFVPDVDSSSPITDFQVGGADGRASVNFTPVNDPDIVSYKLSWTDDPSNWLLINSTAIPAGEDAYLLNGLTPNQPYKFVLAAVSLVDTSESVRAERFALLDRAVTSLGSGKDRETNFGIARAAIVAEAVNRQVQVDPSTIDALAHQAVEVQEAFAAWADKNRDPAFAQFIAEQRSRAANADRSTQITRRYTDSYFAMSDVVTIGNAVGNNLPVFTEKPEVYATKGSVYSQQLVATDPDGDGVTYGLVSGPTGMTISENGELRWNTSGVASGPYNVTVAAFDGTALPGTYSWILDVVDVVMPGEFAIESTPDNNVIIGETWSYTPSTANADSSASPAWELVEAPAGMMINPATGATTWDTSAVTLPESGLTSFRVIILVREGGTMDRTAVQEFTLNVENRNDTYEQVSLPGLTFWGAY